MLSLFTRKDNLATQRQPVETVYPRTRLLLMGLLSRLPTEIRHAPILKQLGLMPLYEQCLTQASDQLLSSTVIEFLKIAQEVRDSMVADMDATYGPRT